MSLTSNTTAYPYDTAVWHFGTAMCLIFAAALFLAALGTVLKSKGSRCDLFANLLMDLSIFTLAAAALGPKFAPYTAAGALAKLIFTVVRYLKSRKEDQKPISDNLPATLSPAMSLDEASSSTTKDNSAPDHDRQA